MLSLLSALGMTQEQPELSGVPMLNDQAAAAGLKNNFAELRRKCCWIAGVAVFVSAGAFGGMRMTDPGCARIDPGVLVTTVQVDSAGSAECDGVYLRAGYLDGRPAFQQRGSNLTLEAYGGWWLLNRDFGGKSWYAVKSSARVPPRAGWHVAHRGAKPVPTITLFAVRAEEGERLGSFADLLLQIRQLTAAYGIYLFLFLAFTFGRLCFSAASAEKQRTLARVCLSFGSTVGAILFLRLVYLATDCRDAVKGMSDVFLVLGVVGAAVAWLACLFVCLGGSWRRQMDDLIARIAEHEAQHDSTVLAVDVSLARYQRFLVSDTDRDASISVLTSGRCYRVQMLCLVLTVLGLTLVHILVHDPEAPPRRSADWYQSSIVLLPGLLVLLAVCRLSWTRCWQRWSKRRALDGRLVSMQGPVRLVFFDNSGADDAARAADPSRLNLMSVVFFDGRAVAFFPPQAPPVPGSWRSLTKTSVEDDIDEDPGCALVSFTTTWVRHGAGIMDLRQTVESTTRVPLDRGQAGAVREWLHLHRVAFGYGAFELELQ